MISSKYFRNTVSILVWIVILTLNIVADIRSQAFHSSIFITAISLWVLSNDITNYVPALPTIRFTLRCISIILSVVNLIYVLNSELGNFITLAYVALTVFFDAVVIYDALSEKQQVANHQ